MMPQAFDLWMLSLRASQTLIEAQTVIALRLMGMSGALPARRGESRRMVMEKPPVFLDAWWAWHKAALAGADATAQSMAALKPISRKVTANRRRLTRV